MSRWHADIALLALLVTFPVIGVLSVLCIGILILQKLRLQTRLDDSCWWLINYSDITIIRDSQVCLSVCMCTVYVCVCVCLPGFVLTGVFGVFASPPGSGFISEHSESECEQRLSVHFLQQQLWF